MELRIEHDIDTVTDYFTFLQLSKMPQHLSTGLKETFMHKNNYTGPVPIMLVHQYIMVTDLEAFEC